MLCSVLAATAVLALSIQVARAQGACLITLPPNPPFVPPAPYLRDVTDDAFWYGTEALWTSLSINGKWGGLHNDEGYRSKLFFWVKGYDWRKEPEPELIVTGRRLDGDAPDLAVAHANNAFLGSRDAAAMVTAFEIPTVGCWELTAHYRGHRLTWVVLVEP